MCEIVKKTCEVIWKVLKPEYVKAPSSENDWRAICLGISLFVWIMQYQYLIGAIDGKTYCNSSSTKCWIYIFQLQRLTLNCPISCV